MHRIIVWYWCSVWHRSGFFHQISVLHWSIVWHWSSVLQCFNVAVSLTTKVFGFIPIALQHHVLCDV